MAYCRYAPFRTGAGGCGMAKGSARRAGGQSVIRAPARALKAVARRALAARGLAIVRPTAYLGRDLLIDVLDPTGSSDFVRRAALELCAHDIAGRNIDGAVAELGVYRGEFARRINQAFPGRTLYLFDTFEGFDPKQEEDDRRERGLSHVHDFGDTSAEIRAIADASPRTMRHQERSLSADRGWTR